MPFSQPFPRKRLIDQLRRLHAEPMLGHGIGVAAVAGALALRFAVDPYVADGLSFITFYPAVIIATLVGGLRPGLLALGFSALASWYFFLPPHWSWELGWDGIVSLLLFIAISLLNIGVVVLLDTTIEGLAAQEKNVRTLIESAPNGIVVVNDQGNIALTNAALERLSGYDRSELLGKSVDLLVPNERSAGHRGLREAYMRQPEERTMGAGRDLKARRKDGSEVPVEIGLSPVRGGGRTAVVATVIDISTRKRVQETQQILIRELQHRTQNLFAVIQSIANNTLSKGRTPAEGRYAFDQRLQALARAYDVVADAAWAGASLAQIIDRQFAGYGDRISIRGCAITVRVEAAQQFALILHELATNAIKYGALSVPEGHVELEGHIDGSGDDPIFSLLWREHGGPRVDPPSHKGFGSTILLEVAGRFGRKVAIDHLPGGLRYELHLALRDIALEGDPTTAGDGRRAI